MIIRTNGDITLTECEYLVQGMAEQRIEDMKTGLAKAIHTKWPETTKRFKKWRRDNPFDKGALYVDNQGTPKLINLATQEDLMRANIPYVNQAMRNLAGFLERQDPTTIALPKVGCGYGKLDWKEVEPIVEGRLNNLDHTIFLYEGFVPGQKSPDEQKYFHDRKVGVSIDDLTQAWSVLENLRVSLAQIGREGSDQKTQGEMLDAYLSPALYKDIVRAWGVLDKHLPDDLRSNIGKRIKYFK